jgi:mono/diheme cytochrome c family protein
MDAPNLTKSELDAAARIEIITNGKGVMQPFGGMLTEEEIQAVATYVETLKK